MTMTDETDEVAAEEEREHEEEQAREAAEGDSEPLEEAAPEVQRLYFELRDLEAAGTTNLLETGRKLVELADYGESGRSIAKRSKSIGIEACSSQAQVSRLSAYASLIDAAISEYGPDWNIPSEFAVRPLALETSPDGGVWSLDGRLELLTSARMIADEEHTRVQRRHVKVALEKDYPAPPRPESLPMAPRVRKALAAMERVGKEHGHDAVLRAYETYVKRHADEPEEAAPAEEGNEAS